jgi:S1-C subfamily serine protease
VRRIGLTVILLGILTMATIAAEQTDHRRTPVVIAVEKVAPAVVNISTEKRVTRQFAPFPFDRDMERYFRRFGTRRSQTLRSVGSGAIIDPDGYVVTNSHVVAAASKIQVTVLGVDGRERTYLARFINSDPDNDLALIKIDGGPFPYVEIAAVDDLMIGETVIAVGNPIGLGHTVTTGVLSARRRSLAVSSTVKIPHLLQTDASINPGNSGGPLLDINGRLIGINTAIVRYVQGISIEGIGFSIPAGIVRSTVDALLDCEKEELGGITMGARLEPGPVGKGGVVVAEVAESGPAKKAGLQVGDVLATLDGRPVVSLFTFKKSLLGRRAGDELKLMVRRRDSLVAATVEIAKIPIPEFVRLARDRLGVDVQSPEESGLKQGLLVVAIRSNGPAHRIGIQPGDVLLELGGQVLRGKERLVIVLKKAIAKKPIPIRVWRQGVVLSGSLELD